MSAALNIPLLGRARELDELSELVADAARGVGGVVLLGGEPGIGKSRLAEAAAEMARAAGLASVWRRSGDGAGRARGRHPSGPGRRWCARWARR